MLRYPRSGGSAGIPVNTVDQLPQDQHLARAIALNNRIEELRFQASMRQLRLREKLEFKSCWDELKKLIFKADEVAVSPGD